MKVFNIEAEGASKEELEAIKIAIQEIEFDIFRINNNDNHLDNESKKWRFSAIFGRPGRFVRATLIRRPLWTGSNRNRKIVAFFTKSKSFLSSATPVLADQPRITENQTPLPS